MTPEEAMKCRQAAQLYRALRKENERLRQELEERNRIDLRMNAEDAEVIAIVTGHVPVRRDAPVSHTPGSPIFDFDLAEIEGLDGEIVEVLDCEDIKGTFAKPRFSYYIRFALFLIIECAVWLAHHVGAIDFLAAFAIAMFMYLLASYFRVI